MLLNVAVNLDLAPAVERVAQDFNRQEHRADGRCTQVQVTEATSATVAGRIDGQDSKNGMPCPSHAWIPDSSLWVDVARSFPLGARDVQPTGISVARSPLVIGCRRQWRPRPTPSTPPRAGACCCRPPTAGRPVDWA